MLNETAQTVVSRFLKQMPIKTLIVVPFVPLPEFAAHEQQLLARMPVHPGVEHPEVRKLLPLLARHFADHRLLSVNDLVVAQHEHEVLLKRVDQGKRDVSVVKPAVDRIERHVLKEVVHPTHVPFESKTKTAKIRRPRYSRPGGRLFGNRHDAGESFVADLVKPLQEINRIEV